MHKLKKKSLLTFYQIGNEANEVIKESTKIVKIASSPAFRQVVMLQAGATVFWAGAAFLCARLIPLPCFPLATLRIPFASVCGLLAVWCIVSYWVTDFVNAELYKEWLKYEFYLMGFFALLCFFWSVLR
ncbi:hypothetical protein [Desulfosarcina ovata]|uniref:hypothetical protein n=1 Tax=Desulfosarcina ovata TaxID=83564 RepID=UPI0012D330E5|nr:hypothetical protein [Desulfosarcina ovata]